MTDGAITFCISALLLSSDVVWLFPSARQMDTLVQEIKSTHSMQFSGKLTKVENPATLWQFDWQKNGILVLWPGILFGTWTIQLQVYVVDEVQTTLLECDPVVVCRCSCLLGLLGLSMVLFRRLPMLS